LSVLYQHGQLGLCFYDSKDSSLHYMLDASDSQELHLLDKVLQEIHPHVIITSAKQEHCMTSFLQQLGSNPDYKPEIVTYPYVDFGKQKHIENICLLQYILNGCLQFTFLFLNTEDLNVSKQRLLSAHLPFLPASISEREKLAYLSSCISFDSPLMVSWLSKYFQIHKSRPCVTVNHEMAVGALLKCLDRRRVGVELEDSSVGVPILQFHAYTLKGIICIDHDTYSVLQIFKSELHPSVYKLHSGEKEGLSLYDVATKDVSFSHQSEQLAESLQEKRRMMGLSDFLTDVARRELEQLDARITSCCVIYIPLIGFLLSLPRLPSMVEKEDFEIQGLDFMLNASDVKVLDLIAELDCLMAMSMASQEYGYTSPKLTHERRITVTRGRHPLLELCSPVFVPNSFQSLDSQGRVKVITGPNSSGKSIYLKQVGLIVFMALIGSDVPAKEAEIGLVDGIYTRMQSRESVSVGLSTFMIDLNQMAQALNNSTGNSLVLIDEFGKGTNTVDGLSLLAASISHWLKKAAVDVPHVLVATNFHSLLQLGLLPSSGFLSLLTLETAVDGDELVFLYQLKEGICQSSYAANIATLAGLAPSLVQRGVEVSELYRTGKPIKQIDTASTDKQAKRCRFVVEKFLSLHLDDADVDLQRFMKEEVLPSGGELLN
ncbi:unnamed protein product, partial [Tetraodon nigroviridis]